MTDLEIIRLCAEAMGYKFYAHHWAGDDRYISRATDKDGLDFKFDPLHDDAQMTAIVKKLKLKIEREAETHPRWIAYEDYPTGKFSARNNDLNYAVCECAAKIELAKVAEPTS